MPGLEQHIWVLEGVLEVTYDDRRYEVRPGDCRRFRLWGSSWFRCTSGKPVRYVLLLVLR